MFRKPLMLCALALTTSMATIPSAAVAYDPCVRAQQDVAEAEAAFRRWVAVNCPSNGSCSGNPQRFLQLYQDVQDARARASRACN